MNNIQLQTVSKALLDDIYNQLLSLQEKYKTEEVTEDLGIDEQGDPITRTYTRDKFFQLLETHTEIPADNVTVAEDVDGKTPTDQSETYTAFGLVLPAKMPCSISVSPYQSPIGWGFELRGKVIDDGDEYQRVMNYGDESYRDTGGWVEIIKE